MSILIVTEQGDYMIIDLKEIKVEWNRYEAVLDFHDYLYKWFVPTYDHNLNFVGFRRKT